MHDMDDTPEPWPPVYYTNTVQVITTAFDLQLHCSVQTRPRPRRQRRRTVSW